jgi:hypothetical protein
MKRVDTKTNNGNFRDTAVPNNNQHEQSPFQSIEPNKPIQKENPFLDKGFVQDATST